MRKSLLPFVFFSAVLLSACGNPDTWETPSSQQPQSTEPANITQVETQRFEYSYRIGNCATGKHIFDDLRDFCVALADEDRNNNCASSLRCIEFHKKCSELELDVSCL